MYCPNCGSQQPDTARFCSSCGTPLDARTASVPPVIPPENVENDQAPAPAAAPVPSEIPNGKGKGSRKWFKIGVTAIMIAAIIVGVFFAVKYIMGKKNAPESPLQQAAENTLSRLKDMAEPLPNLKQIIQNVDDLSDVDALALRVVLKTDSEDSLAVRCGIDAGEKKLLLNGVYSADNTNLAFDLYVDREQCQIGSSTLMGTGEAIMFPIKNLAKEWNNSALRKMTNVELPASLDTLWENLEKDDFDYDNALETEYGESWTRFRDSVQFEATSGPGETGDTVYALRWDDAALSDLVSQMGDADSGSVSLQGILDGSKDLNTAAAEQVLAMLRKLQMSLNGIELTVRNDMLTGLRATFTENEQKKTAEITLDGQNNPWESISLKLFLEKPDGTREERQRYNISMKAADGVFSVESQRTVAYSDGHTDTSTSSIQYVDATGEISYTEWPDNFQLAVQPVNAGVKVQANHLREEIAFSFELTENTDKIQPISPKPQNILKMSEQELQALAMQIYAKAMSVGSD